MEYIVAIVVGYLLGCSHMSYYLAKLKNVDIKGQGSKNYGASNTFALLGKKYGILVGIHDIGKAVAAVLLLECFYPTNPYIGAIAGVSCVLGHIYPFYLNFNGGKGFASFLGLVLGLDWRCGLILLLTTLVVSLLTNYIAMGTIISLMIAPIEISLLNNDTKLGCIVLVASIFLFVKSIDNIKKIKNGTEMKISNAFKSEYKARSEDKEE